MIKKILFISFLIALSSCHADEENGQPTSKSTSVPASAYLNCEAVPSGNIISHNGCPGASGTWNNYEVKMNQDGSLVSINKYCGGLDTEHPVNQSEYDGYASFDETSNADFKLSEFCASGTRIHNASGERTANIWQKI